MTVVRHILSVLALPTVVTIVVPYLIVLSGSPSLAAWRAGHPLQPVALAGGLVVVACGLALVVATVRWFAKVGRGTLAPWDPPRRLVVVGVYRYVRNPMISGVLTILFGEALAFRSPGLFAWAATFFAINAIYIPLVEERGLERRFGADYRTYRQHVPRWVPRRTPWEPPWR